MSVLSKSLVTALALAAGLAAAQPAGAEKKRPVEAPHYGDALFHFFQEKYFSAVTTLMASQHFGRVAPHDDESEILRGGLLLSYGMHQEAGRIFAALIERGAPPSVRDRAWYFLAKIRWQRGDALGAEEALARIGDKLAPALAEDRALLQSNVLMARGDFAGAATVLRGVDPKSGAGAYVRYNLGVALAKSGDAAGRTLLDEVGRMPGADEEQRSLRDRANVALGFSALSDGRVDEARAALQRVRLQSPQASRALLGFGWAEAADKKHERALVPWSELAARPDADAAVLEARIAVPYAYAEIGAYGQAHEAYEQALAGFEREHGALDESIAALKSGRVLTALAEANPGEEMGWFWSLKTLPAMPHAAHLSQLLAGHEFQESFKNWRDLLFLQRNLERWRESLAAFNDMLAHRREVFAKRMPGAQAGRADAAGSTVALDKRRAELAAELQRVESEADAVAFADDRQDALLQRLAGVQLAMKSLPAGAVSEAMADKARLAAGVLAWEMARDYPGRLWEANKQMQAADQQLAQARERGTRLEGAARGEPAKFDAFARRIAALDARLSALAPRVTALAGEQQQQVQGIAVAALQTQQQRLAEHRTQARFALAQLVDKALVARSASDGSTKESRDAPRR